MIGAVTRLMRATGVRPIAASAPPPAPCYPRPVLPPQTLTGTRRAVLRSVFVAVLCAALAGLVTCMLPGHETVLPGHDPSTVVVRHEQAGGPLLTLAMLAATLVAAFGLALPRREATVLAAGTLTMLAFPLAIWHTLVHLGPSFVQTRPLWPAHVLDLAVPVLIFAGPVLAVLGWLLFRLEARAGRPAIPVAVVR